MVMVMMMVMMLVMMLMMMMMMMVMVMMEMMVMMTIRGLVTVWSLRRLYYSKKDTAVHAVVQRRALFKSVCALRTQNISQKHWPCAAK